MRDDRVEFVWLVRFWQARWRGRKTARLIRQMREVDAIMTFDGAHALHEAASP